MQFILILMMTSIQACQALRIDMPSSPDNQGDGDHIDSTAKVDLDRDIQKEDTFDDDQEIGSDTDLDLLDVDVSMERKEVHIGNWVYQDKAVELCDAKCGCSGRTGVHQDSGSSKKHTNHVWEHLFGKGVDVQISKEEQSCGQRFPGFPPPSPSSLTLPYSIARGTAGCGKYPTLSWYKKVAYQYYVPRLTAKAELEEMASELKDHLVIHLRGSDILTRSKDFSYFPAPCAYFDHVINHGNKGSAYDKVRLIAEPGHPCVSTLQRKNPSKSIIFKPGTIVSDWMVLMAATNVALSTDSTYGMAAVGMNIHPEVTVYWPEYIHQEKGMSEMAGHGHGVCEMGKNSVLYAIPKEPISKYKNNRIGFITNDEHFQNTKIYKCSEQ